MIQISGPRGHSVATSVTLVKNEPPCSKERFIPNTETLLLLNFFDYRFILSVTGCVDYKDRKACVTVS